MASARTSIDRRSLVKGAGATTLGLLGASALATKASADEAMGGFTFADTISWTHEYDVIVIGFGGAGGVAAITAADNGAHVLLCEKAPKGEEGGNTQYSGQNFGCCDPSEVDMFVEYYKNLRGDYSTPSDEMIQAWVEEFSKNEEWITTQMGVTDYVMEPKTEEPELAPEGLECMRMRITNAVVDGKEIGNGYWPVIEANVLARPDTIDVWYGSPVTHLVQDPFTKTILGVQVERDSDVFMVRARNGVVMCCGGIEASKEMLENYLGLSNVHPIGTMYNTGDGVRMAIEVGANLWHMANVLAPWISFFPAEQQARPVFPPINPFKGTSYIQVGPKAQRWHNEFERNNHSRINVQGESMTATTFDTMWNILDQAGLDAGIDVAQAWCYMPSENFEAELEAGVLIKADTVAELAEKIGLDGEALQATVDEFNACAEAGEDVKYGRDPETMTPISATGPYYAWQAVRGVLNSQGGAVRNENCEVLDTNGNPIPHLYSAGEFGFLMAKLYNGGGNLGDTGASGRIAGRNAATEKKPLASISLAPVEQAEVTTETLDPQPEYTSTDTELYGTFAGIKLITVKVTMDGNAIASVEVIDSGESHGVGTKAIEVVPSEIVAAQSLAVDTVTGATRTSSGIIGACREALKNECPDLAATAPDLGHLQENKTATGGIEQA